MTRMKDFNNERKKGVVALVSAFTWKRSVRKNRTLEKKFN